MTNNKELGRGTATFEHAQSFKSLSYKKEQRHISVKKVLTSPFTTSIPSYFYALSILCANIC